MSDDEREGLWPLTDGEHEILAGSQRTSEAIRSAPRRGPRCCWTGGVAEYDRTTALDHREAAVRDVLVAFPEVSRERAERLVDEMLVKTSAEVTRG